MIRRANADGGVHLTNIISNVEDDADADAVVTYQWKVTIG
jgi:hypothetical protein